MLWSHNLYLGILCNGKGRCSVKVVFSNSNRIKSPKNGRLMKRISSVFRIAFHCYICSNGVFTRPHAETDREWVA